MLKYVARVATLWYALALLFRLQRKDQSQTEEVRGFVGPVSAFKMTTDPDLPQLQAHCGLVQGPSDNILSTENGYHIRQISLPAAERERETLNTISCFSGGYAPVSYLPGLFACAVGTRFSPCIPGFCRLATVFRPHFSSTYHPLPPHVLPAPSPRTTHILLASHLHLTHVFSTSRLRQTYRSSNPATSHTLRIHVSPQRREHIARVDCRIEEKSSSWDLVGISPLSCVSSTIYITPFCSKSFG